MINKDKTKLKYQYDISELSPTSAKPVVWCCDNPQCLNEREFSFAYYVKKQNHAKKNNEGIELCQKCAHKHRSENKQSENKEKKHKAINLPEEVNEQRTMEKFGEKALEIPPWSRKKVILNCSSCHKECESSRCNLNMYESILQTGHFKCKGCYTGERRKGVVVSSETKKKMIESQNKRRNQESIEKWGYPQVAAVANGDAAQLKIKDINKEAIIIPLKKKL